VDMFGTVAQRRRYLAAARRGERVGALAISERAAGSDLREITTTAVRDAGGGYVLDGEKYYVANGSQADFYIVLARTRRVAGARGLAGASLVVVDADSPGVRREPQPMLGWHAADVCRIELRNVAVPPGGLIGRQDRALTQLMRALDFERLVAGLLAVGGVRYCLELLYRFVREHRVGAGPLSANQVVRHRVADLGAEFELVRRFAEHATGLHCRGELDTRDASILKVRATELAVAAATTAMQYHGARGYLDGSDVSRLHRDAAAGTIAAGANEVLRDMIFETTWPET
jgi:acyl-CoA dehydrogenase